MSVRSMSAFYNLHPLLPAHAVMHDKETCEFQFQMDILKFVDGKNQEKIFFISEDRFELADVPTPQNQKIVFI